MIKNLKYLAKHAGFVKYFKNTSWLFAEKILRMTVGLLVGVWVARYLGPEEYGLLSYSQSFVGMFAALGTLGLDGVLVRELIKTPNKRDSLLGSAFALKLAGAVLMLAVLSIAVISVSDNYSENILIFIISSSVFFQSFNVIDFYFQSKVLSRYVVYANTVSLLTMSIFRIFLVLYDAPLLMFAIALLIESIVVAIGFIYIYQHNSLSIKKWKFEKIIAKKILKDSWPLILAGALLGVQARIDQVMLKHMIGNDSVGMYSVALRLIEAISFLPMLLKSSLSPSIIKSKEATAEKYRDRLLNFYRLNFIMSLLIILPVFVFAQFIVDFLYGHAYQAAGVLLSLMSIRLFFTNMGVARSVYIVTENLFKFSLVTMLIGTIVNVSLNYIWIKAYGASGAIMATIVSFTITVFVIDFIYKRTRSNVILMLYSIVSFQKINFRGI